MVAWKKIAALFALSMSAGILGAACTAEVKEAAAAVDPTAAVETPDDAANATLAPGFGPRRCEDRCRIGYAQCGRDRSWSRDPRERERRCRTRLNGCLRSCPRF
jgi:hypothetical protein